MFRSVLEKDPDGRGRWRVCRDRARIDVESLLFHEGPAETFLEGSVFQGGHGEPEVVAGARVGPYRLERKLGDGGMGVVWLAERADEQYRQKVAVKLVKAGMDGEDILARFRSERQVLARLEHPHIAAPGRGATDRAGRPVWIRRDAILPLRRAGLTFAQAELSAMSAERCRTQTVTCVHRDLSRTHPWSRGRRAQAAHSPCQGCSIRLDRGRRGRPGSGSTGDPALREPRAVRGEADHDRHDVIRSA